MVYLLPGMGATNAMYSGPWRDLPNAQFLDWPRDFTGTTLTQLAQRLIDDHHITPADTLIGTSLGGMVASEISNLITLRQLILISSATHPSEISPLLATCHPLINLIPLTLLRTLCAKLPFLTTRMFAQTDPRFLRLTTKAVFQWQGDQGRSPLFRIHGTRDPVITRPKSVNSFIKGGHLITLTHKKDCLNALPTILPT
ncbi:MAG: alpha/beta fold hydrolase [Verrucomicrobiaceae bacterium]